MLSNVCFLVSFGCLLSVSVLHRAVLVLVELTAQSLRQRAFLALETSFASGSRFEPGAWAVGRILAFSYIGSFKCYARLARRFLPWEPPREAFAP